MSAVTPPIPTDVGIEGAEPDVIVVGGGLAGLAAATQAARAGAQVVLIEARSEPGGRARTDRVDGFGLNQGAHALYRAGAGRAVLRDLGIRPSGGIPRQRGGAWLVDGRRVTFRHLSEVGGRAGLTALRTILSRRAAADAEGRSTADWMDDHVPDEARSVVEALVRTTTYGADHAHSDAAAVLAQVRLGAQAVLYLHGGWSSIVDALHEAASQAGVVVAHGKVTSVTPDDGAVTVTTGSGVARARSVVLAAGGPAQAAALLGSTSPRVSAWAAEARPILATCLDVALDRVPNRRWSTSYSLDEPLYLVDHAATAKVAPEGGGLFHGLWYEPGLTPGIEPRERLEAALDLVQPGWRDHVVASKHRRTLVVAHDRATPDRPASVRPTVAVDDAPGVYVAGDWLTGHGMLADAALGSAAEAGRLAAGRRHGTEPTSAPRAAVAS